jgi:hypothetical protein
LLAGRKPGATGDAFQSMIVDLNTGRARTGTRQELVCREGEPAPGACLDRQADLCELVLSLGA